MWWIAAVTIYLLVGLGVARLLAGDTVTMARDWGSTLRCVLLWPLLVVAFVIVVLADDR